MKAVLITGGSRGIGAAMVKAFTATGCKVAFLYRKNEEAAKSVQEQTGALGLQCDVTDFTALSETVRAAKMYLEVPYFDTLICNAGISAGGLFLETTEEQWKDILSTNLNGCIYAAQALLPAMIENKAGSVVMVSSVWGQTGASCEVAYSVSKAAVIGLTKSLAKEVALSGVRVNCIAPGVIDTEMNSCYSKEDMEALAEDIPLGRIGTAEEAAEAAVFLASEKASYITGQILGVNGGFYI